MFKKNKETKLNIKKIQCSSLKSKYCADNDLPWWGFVLTVLHFLFLGFQADMNCNIRLCINSSTNSSLRPVFLGFTWLIIEYTALHAYTHSQTLRGICMKGSEQNKNVCLHKLRPNYSINKTGLQKHNLM